MHYRNIRRIAFVALAPLCVTASLADSITYSYDALGRLVEVATADGTVTTYNYDPSGNRTSKSVADQSAPPPNNPPDAINDWASGITLNYAQVFDLVANDSDPDNDPLAITGFTQPWNATVQQQNDHEVLIIGRSVGTGTFTYTISDGNGGSDTATVTVTVNSQ